VDVLSRTIPNLPEKLSFKVEKRMKKMGIRVMLNTSVVRMGPDFVETKSNDELTKEGTYTVIWAAGIESAEVTNQAAQKLQAGGRGRIATDAYLRSLDDETVYVIGDNMLYTPEGEERPVPQVVENCEHSAATAAHNIICAVTGQGQMEKYQPAFHGFMVCIGGRYGVARVGLPNRMFNLPSWLAMFSKHFINIVYFVQVLGWNKVFSYMRHEFFTIRNKRSFVGGHFSNRTPSFLLVPIRVWLGAVWLFEGVMKIVEGWFTEPKLTAFFGGAQAWYNNIINSAGDGAAEQAGNAAAHIGTVIFNIDFLGLVQAVFVSGKALAQATMSDLAFKLDIPIMNWFIDKFILSSDTMQVVMQVFIVMAEILIGLALIGGLFTCPASAFSLVLQFMFVTTTGLYLTTFWMIFAAIAVLIGGGQTLGLDYYVMPVLKRSWKKVPWVKKSYLYND